MLYDEILNIDPANEAIKFIVQRIEDNDYRGHHLSQHNRYDLSVISIVLSELDKYEGLMQIRDTDISKRPENTEGERDYAMFCNEVKTKTGIASQDAMRKNIFVDLSRMGFINRYDKHKNLLDPYKKLHVKYVSISDLGKSLVQSNNELDKFFIYSKALNNLLQGQIEYLLKLFLENNITKISTIEHMLFISAINTGTNYSISVDRCSELIKSYRSLGLRKNSVVDILNKKLQPENYNGNKIVKRDFHNWKNESQQLIDLLGQTVYFEKNDNRDLFLKLTSQGFADEEYIKLKRSLPEKQKYFKNHDVDKAQGFELHHVVPLAYAESREHFKLLDKWENLVYIDAFSHAKITQNKNKNIFMKAMENDIELDELENEYSHQCVKLIHNQNIKYNSDLQQTLLGYNKKLINCTYYRNL